MVHVQQGGEIMGICGGFQMLGNTIADPQHVETGGSSKGLGLLDVETTLLTSKKTVQVRARSLLGPLSDECLVEGYEIHMGVTTRAKTVPPCFQVLPDESQPFSGKNEYRDDGAMREDGVVWGTYIHGVFDQPEFRRQWLNRARARKKLSPLEVETSQAVSERLVHALDRWADHVGSSINLELILAALGLRNDNVS